MDFRKVTPEHIRLYRNEVLKSASASTFDRKMFSLRKFFDWAVKEGYTDENPAEEFLKSEAETLEVKLGKIEKQKKAESPSYNSVQARIIAKLAGKPKLQKLAYGAFYTRPNWYKSYHSLPIASYFNYGILVLLMSALGFGVYNQFFKTTSTPLAYPTTLTTAGRFLSFQGRLTNNLGNPITTARNVDFKLYNASASGTLLWDSGACSITPDTDGIFSTLLGSSCGAEIGSSVFSENPAVWLGVTVGTDTEATPRVQIATVAYALNSQTLQGYPASESATANTIPAINSSGYLVLGTSSPKIMSTSGNFAIQGQTMTFTTPSASNGNITVAPDGTGVLNLTFTGAAPGGSAKGFVNATDANLTSGSLYYGAVANGATGYNLLQLQSGSTLTDKFVVDYGGNVVASGTINGLTISGGTISGGTWNGTVIGTGYGGTGQNWSGIAQGSIPYFNGTGTMSTIAPSTSGYILSTNGTGANPSWIPASGVGTNYWQLTTNSLSPVNSTYAFNVGNTASTSALFHAPGTTNSDAWFNLGTGKLGIGTTSPTATLHVSGTTGNIFTISDATGDLVTVSPTQTTFNNPTYFASSGDVSIAYDLLFNNPMASYIKSSSPLYIQAGETYNSSDLTLRTFNSGDVVIDAGGTGSSSGTLKISDSSVKTAADTTPIAFATGSADINTFRTNFLNETLVGSINEAYKAATGLGGGVWSDTGTYIYPTTAGSSAMAILGSGNVGIGLINPSSKLDIKGTAGLSPFNVASSSGTSILNVAANGNVGIGTTSPSSALSVTGAISASSLVATPIVRNGGGTLDFQIWNGSWVDALYINNSANVGIGTTSPTAKLDVAGDASTSGALVFRGTSPANIDVLNGDRLAFNTSVGGDTGLTERMTILNNGNVGIGTTSPSYALDVKGTTLASAINSDMGLNFNYVVPFNSSGLTLSLVAEAGNLGVGTYYYTVTYVTTVGETDSNSYKSIVTTAGNTKVDITLPISSDYRVTGRKIYRTLVDGFYYQTYYLTTVNDNTTVTYRDNIADASLDQNQSGFWRPNTTNKAITKNGSMALTIDKNLTTLGLYAGDAITTGGGNTLVGANAGTSLTSGSQNTFLGSATGLNTTTGGNNVAIGQQAFQLNVTGDANIAIGRNSLYQSTGGSNTAVGSYSGSNINAGGANVFVGSNSFSGSSVTPANLNYNTALGGYTGYVNLGSGNVFLGYAAGRYETGSSTLFIDNQSRTDEATSRTSSMIYGIFNSVVANQKLTINAGTTINGYATASASLAIGNVNAVAGPGNISASGTIAGLSIIQNGNTVCDSSGNCSGVGNLWRLNGEVVSPVQAAYDLVVGGTATGSAFQVFAATGNVTLADLVITGGNINPSSNLTIGDNGDTLYLNSSDWDIGATGDMSGIGSISMNGAVTGSTGFNGLVVTPNTGVVTTGTWNGTAIGATYGGTGQTVYAVGDLLYANTTTTLNKLADVATGNVLISGGVNTAPSWGKVVLGTHTSGNYVSSIAGTANQITASASTGAVTLSIPSDFRAPGTVNAVNGIYTGATAGTQRIDASGNLLNIANISASGYATVSGSLALGNTTAAAGPGNLNMSGILTVPQICLSGDCQTTWPTGSVSYWRLDATGKVLSPIQTAYDLTVGGEATSSSKFQIMGATGNIYTANNTVDWTLNNTADALNFDTNTLSLDALYNRVGIGTAAPGEKLEVTGNILASNNAARVYITALSSNTIGPEFRIASTDTGGHEYRIGSSASGNSIGAGSFYFYDQTYSAMRFVIDRNGLFGMGKNTPTAKLDVADSSLAGINDNIVSATSSAMQTGNLLKIGEGGTQNFTGNAIFADVANGGGGSFTGNFIKFNNKGTTAFVVDSLGNADIRGVTYSWPTAAASGILTSDGSGNLSWGSAGTNYWRLDGSGKVLSPIQTAYDLTVGGEATSSSKFQIMGTTGNIYTANNTVDWTLNNAADALNFDANTLSIDALNNRVGIGTTGPDSPLDVLSTGGSQLRLTYTDGTVYTTLNTDSSGNFTIDATGTKTIITDDLQITGNHILDSAAATRVSLGATTTLTNTTTTLSGTTTMTASSLATLTTSASLAMSSTTGLTLGGNSTINGGSASAGTLRIDSTGNATKGNVSFNGTTTFIDGLGNLKVGGYATASASLNVGSGNALAGIGNISYSNALLPGGAAGTSGYLLTSAGGGVNTWTNPANVGTNHWQLGSNILAPINITNDLAIGGNSTASAKFQIFGATGNATMSGNLTLGFGKALQSAYGPLTLNYKSGANTWAAGLTVSDVAGNVGIGTTSPLARLDVVDKTSLATIGTEMITATADRDFSSSTGNWTGTNWSVTGGVGNHTPAGSSSFVLSNTALSSAPIAGHVYKITYTVNTTIPGSNRILFGNAAGGYIGQDTGADGDTVVLTATNTNPLTFATDATWVGSIDNVSVMEITPSSFALRLQNSDGTASPIEVRPGGSAKYNLFMGASAGQSLTTGTWNTGIGYYALSSNISGAWNTALGNALVMNTGGDNNTAIGDSALYYNTLGSGNSAVGTNSLNSNRSGSYNSAFGYKALQLNTVGWGNTAVGYGSLNDVTTGEYNTGIGYQAGFYVTTGSENVFLGDHTGNSGGQKQDATNSIAIGYNVNTTANNQVVLGNDFITQTLLKGNVVLNGTLDAGGSSGTNYNAFAGTGDSPAATTAITASNDLFVGGDMEIKGGFYLTGKNIFNVVGGVPTGAITFSTDPALINNYNILTNGSWLVNNSTNNGIAALMINQAKGGDIFTASASGVPKMTLTNAGNLGIGTTTPNNLIQVAGLINFDNTDFNTKIGYQAGNNFVSGAQHNTFLGYQSGFGGSGTNTADNNSSVGYQALYSNTSGIANTALGSSSLFSNNSGGYNTAIGYQAMYDNTTGTGNSALGYAALTNNLSGLNNTAVGNQSLFTAISASSNTAVGAGALSLTTAGLNTAIGESALSANTSGQSNVAIGVNAGRFITGGSTANQTSSNSLYLGYNTMALANGDTNEIVIGASATGNGSDSVTLGNTSITKTILQGNVGIGTTAPVSTLSVTGSSRFSGSLINETGFNSIGDQESMIPNSGFEVNDDGTTTVADAWVINSNNTGGNPSVTADTVQGAKAQTLYATTTTEMSISSSCFPITYGHTYNVYIMAKANVATGDGFYLRTAVYSDTACATYSTGSDNPSNGNVSTGWTKYGGTTAALNGKSARIIIYNSAPTNTSTITVDALRVTPSAITDTIDVAENYYTDENLVSGQLVKASSSVSSGVSATTQDNESSLIGIVSTKPAITLGGVITAKEGQKIATVALSGRVPTIVSSKNGDIRSGDYITSSSGIPGVGTKSVKSGRVVGMALEDKIWKNSSCQIVGNYSNIVWPSDDGSDSQERPCYQLADGTYVGKIMVFVNPTWNSPEVYLASSGDLQIIGDGNGNYRLTDSSTSNIVETIGAFAKLVAANIKAGAVVTQDLATNSFTAFQGKVDNMLVKSGLVAGKIQTKLISPLADSTDVTVQVGNATQSGKFAVQNAIGTEVASIDNSGNATFSGTLFADNINSKSLDEIKNLLTKVQTDQSLLASASAWSITATSSANLDSIATADLYVTNQAAINSLSVTNTLTIGADMVLDSTSNSIETLTSPLKIQSLAMAPIEMMAGLIKIDTSGNVQIAGNLAVAGKIESAGLSLKDNQPVATSSALLTLQNAEGANVATVDASGSAMFNNVSTQGLTIAGAIEATNSAVVNGIIRTNATAGAGVVPAGVSEITIENANVTDYTLVYVTPTSSTDNYVLYVKSKGPGRFVVGFTNPISIDVNFNWWIVKVAQ